MNVGKIIAREGLFVALFAMLGVMTEISFISYINHTEKTSWRWYLFQESVLWQVAIFFIAAGYFTRLIVWAVRTLEGWK